MFLRYYVYAWLVAFSWIFSVYIKLNWCAKSSLKSSIFNLLSVELSVVLWDEIQAKDLFAGVLLRLLLSKYIHNNILAEQKGFLGILYTITLA